MEITAAAPVRLVRSLQPHDPELAGLRRAARAVIVIAPLFILCDLVLRQPQMTVFVVFGGFSLLVLADFGGPRRPRAAAYGVGVTIGALLVALGTLASPIPWLAALVTLLVGVAIPLSAVLGGYVAAAQTMLMFSFVLAVSVPAPAEDIGLRVAGWVLAGAACTIAGVFFWPRFEVAKLHHEVAAASRMLADLVDADRRGESGPDLDALRRRAVGACAVTNRMYELTARRPIGPTGRDRAMAELMGELARIKELAAERLSAGGGDEVRDGLAEQVVATLRAVADALDTGGRADLGPLVAARAAHARVLADWVQESMSEGRRPEELLDVADADHTMRILAYLVLAMGANAVVANGGWVEDGLPIPAGTPVHRGLLGIARRAGRTVRSHFHPRSTALHGSLRVGIGLALAVLLARTLNLEHGFWVVLGTVSVLRTTAVATGRTVLQALGGTVLGFAIASAVIVTVGRDEAVLWALLPVCIFLAAYVSSAVGFVAGQAAFTVNVIVIFNLIAPAGWEVGLLRLEDVAAGCAVSVIVGLLLWPRGARNDFREAIIGTYRSISSFLALSYEDSLEGTPRATAESLRAAVVRGMVRVEDTFNQFINERGSRPVAPADAAQLVSGARHALMLGDVLNAIASKGDSAFACPQGRDAIEVQAVKAVGRFRWLGDELAGVPPAEDRGERPSRSAIRAATLRCLDMWRGDAAAAPAAIALESIGDHISHLDGLCDSLDAPVAKAVQGRRVPWWR
ncbi:MAG TPA: FUSC family protein [Candidatus Dormibacteraeota bacterium]|nr:FUSC family protein [Candidatus Dormibacteraeota bacterium]